MKRFASFVFTTILFVASNARADAALDSGADDAGADDAGADAGRPLWDWEQRDLEDLHEKNLTVAELIVRSKAQYRGGQVMLALYDARRALALAKTRNDPTEIAAAEELVTLLEPLVAHVRFVVAKGTKIDSLRVDDRPVPLDSLEKSFSVDPGDHDLEIEGEIEGELVGKTTSFYAESGPKPQPIPIELTHEDLERIRRQNCAYLARDQDEVLNCQKYGRPHACAACELTPARAVDNGSPWALAFALLVMFAARRRAGFATGSR